MDVIVERQGALDVPEAQVTAWVPGPDGERAEEIEWLTTTVAGPLVPRDWPEAHGVSDAAMEARGVCWRPVRHPLEDDLEPMLVNARHVRQVPGQKTDVLDARWLCRLAEAGPLRASLVPPRPIRDLRMLTRCPKAQIAGRRREANRPHRALEDTEIKLDRVATEILGKSGRAMLDALVSETTDPEVPADLRPPRPAGEDPRPARGARGPLRGPARPARRADPLPHRLPGRGDRTALGGDRGQAAPLCGRG